MKDKINVRQICFILAAYGAATKMLLYPTIAASAAGNALIFSALFNVALQTIIIWSIAYLSSKTDKTFFNLLQDAFGKAAARIIIALFGLYFLLSAVLPLNEQQLLVHDAFYDTVPSLQVFTVFFAFSTYAGVKSFTNAGRVADILFPVFVVCVVIFMITSVGEADWGNLAPVFKQPVKDVVGFSLSSVFRFSESAFLLMFMGHYKYKKGDAAKLTLSYAAGGLAVILFFAAFYALYGSLAVTRWFAIDNISVFFPVFQFIGRLDLFVVYAFDLVVLFAIVLNIQMFVYCMCRAFNREWSIVFSVVANAVLLALTIILNYKFSALQSVAGKWFWIPALVFAYVAPVLVWSLKRRFK